MAVSIIIKRVLQNEKMVKGLAPLIIQLRSRGNASTGFITSQTFSVWIVKVSTWS